MSRIRPFPSPVLRSQAYGSLHPLSDNSLLVIKGHEQSFIQTSTSNGIDSNDVKTMLDILSLPSARHHECGRQQGLPMYACAL